MATAVAEKASKDGVKAPGTDNVYQRKAAVMSTFDGWEPMSVHAKFGFKYHSYQAVAEKLRSACIAVGLDITADVVDGEAIITLTNVDNPEDKIVQRFGPKGLPADQAASYVVKYAWMKLFMIGDGEDPDSRLGADAAAVPAPAGQTSGTDAGTSRGEATPSALDAAAWKAGDLCPACIGTDAKAKGKFKPKLWANERAPGGLQCDGQLGDAWMNHHPPRELIAAKAAEDDPWAGAEPPY